MAVEEPLEIRVDTRPVSVTMRTPGHDEELALGFLVGEGLVQARDEVAEVRPYPRNADGNVVDVLLRPDVRVDFARLTRHVFASSSCGLCGKRDLSDVYKKYSVRRVVEVEVEGIHQLFQHMQAEQKMFHQTGGCHAAAAATVDGQLLVFFVMSVAAAEAAIGLAIVIALFRNTLSVNIDEMSLFRG